MFVAVSMLFKEQYLVQCETVIMAMINDSNMFLFSSHLIISFVNRTVFIFSSATV